MREKLAARPPVRLRLPVHGRVRSISLGWADLHYEYFINNWCFSSVEWGDSHRFWTEQYLLQALMTFSYGFQVLWAGSYIHLLHPEKLEKPSDLITDP
jgi:hypothetical protein